MIKNYIFDIDGTIVDSYDLYYRSLIMSLNYHNISIEVDRETINSLIGLTAESALKKLGLNNIEPIRTTWGEYYNKLSVTAPLYVGVKEIIKKLYDKEKNIIIVTSRNRDVTLPFLEREGLLKYIILCVTEEDTIRHKPNPEPIIFTLKSLSISADESVYIGDTQNDYLAAARAGVRFVVAAWNENAKNINGEKAFSPTDLLTL